MTVDTKKLRELAEAATPGPWIVSDKDVFSAITVGSSKTDVCTFDIYEHRPDECAEDAAFVAAANPQTVIALLDEIERLRIVARENVTDEQYDSYVGRLEQQLAAMIAARDEACDLAMSFDVHGSQPCERERLIALRKVGSHD